MSAGNNILLWDFEKNSENLLASQVIYPQIELKIWFSLFVCEITCKFDNKFNQT